MHGITHNSFCEIKLCVHLLTFDPSIWSQQSFDRGIADMFVESLLILNTFYIWIKLYAISQYTFFKRFTYAKHASNFDYFLMNFSWRNILKVHKLNEGTDCVLFYAILISVFCVCHFIYDEIQTTLTITHRTRSLLPHLSTLRLFRQCGYIIYAKSNFVFYLWTAYILIIMSMLLKDMLII